MRASAATVAVLAGVAILIVAIQLLLALPVATLDGVEVVVPG